MDSPTPPGRLTRWRARAGTSLSTLAEGAGFVASLGGTATALVLGRALLAAALAAMALGLLLRLTTRRRAASAARPAPPWVLPAVLALSAVEVAVLVEATDLPVRFHQEGFELFHWVLVLLAYGVAIALQWPLLRRWASPRRIEENA